MLPIVLLILVSFIFCLLLIAIPYFFGPKDLNSKAKASDYECGLAPKEKKSTQISVKFFLTAILFILFDIEIIFLYPFALAYRDFLEMEQALGILFAMGLFLLLFIFGLWWEIKSKALDWK
ncbi:MAG: NADH-quinone oxidoreductase subunit A [Bdellovibrionaceae bacterium]|nr:NADH-quinone oxidoreductase subunit A [Pseudobdellovibrionaceae bacterium]